jgi:uncharacterized membrane protein
MRDWRHRLDAFVDAAFAFALTLLLANTVAAGDLLESLRATIGQLPAFAIGFAILAMFWNEHVAWRRLGGNDRGLAVLLSLLLVFLVLVFVLALRPMAQSLAAFLLAGESAGLDARGVAEVFRVYGAGFAAMCTVTMALHLQGGRFTDEPRHLRGRAISYGILATAGAVSLALTFLPGTAPLLAPWVYAALPLVMGLFAFLYRWDEDRPPQSGAAEPGA